MLSYSLELQGMLTLLANFWTLTNCRIIGRLRRIRLLILCFLVILSFQCMSAAIYLPYLGCTCNIWGYVSGIANTVFVIVLWRAVNVFSCAYIVNLVRPEQRQIPLKHQKALWYSGKWIRCHWIFKLLSFAMMLSLLCGWTGLRGAMAFALALQSVHDLPEGHGQTIFTATTAIVVLTVCILACYLVYQKPYSLLDYLGFWGRRTECSSCFRRDIWSAAFVVSNGSNVILQTIIYPIS